MVNHKGCVGIIDAVRQLVVHLTTNMRRKEDYYQWLNCASPAFQQQVNGSYHKDGIHEDKVIATEHLNDLFAEHVMLQLQYWNISTIFKADSTEFQL